MALPLLLLGAGLVAKTASNYSQAKKEQEMQQQAANQRRQDVANVAMGAGFGQHFGPQIGADPAIQQRLGGIMSGMQSLDPNIQREAIDQLGVLQAEQGIGMTPGEVTDLKAANTDLTIKQMELARLQGGSLDTGEILKTADNLYEDWEGQAAPYQSRLASYDELMSVLDPDNPDPASSVAVLFKFIKSMDDSVVRDSEGRLLTDAGGALGKLANLFNQHVQNQGLFDETTLQEIRYTASELARSTQTTLEGINSRNEGRVARYATQFMAPKLRELVQDPFAPRGEIPTFPRAPRRMGPGQDESQDEDVQNRIQPD